MATREEIEQEAIDRAVNGQSLANYPAIFSGFMEKGIPEAEILPRENVFTYNAWKGLGRQVCKGEHGVKVQTWRESVDKESGEVKRFPKTSTVFHVSQTKPAGEPRNGNGREKPAPKPPAVEFEQSEAPEQRLSVSYGSSSLGTVPGPAEPEGESMTLQTPGGGGVSRFPSSG